MNNKVRQIVTLSLAFFSIALIAKENVEHPHATSVVNTKVAAGCSPSRASRSASPCCPGACHRGRPAGP